MRGCKGMKGMALRAVLVLVILTLITGIAYPLSMTLVAQVLFPDAAGGSLVRDNGSVIGSRLIGQSFSGPGWFEGRPSAVNYTADRSGGGNGGPADRAFIDRVKERVQAFRVKNGISNDTPVPADIVLASGSGLDPHISQEAALLQVPRVARERGIQEPVLVELVRKYSEPAGPDGTGRPRVNVLLVNSAMRKMQGGGR